MDLPPVLLMACEGTTLAHKSQNHSVRAGTFIAKPVLPGSQGMKVFCCLGNFVNSSKETRPKGSLSVAVSKSTTGWPGLGTGQLGAAASGRPRAFFLRHLKVPRGVESQFPKHHSLINTHSLPHFHHSFTVLPGIVSQINCTHVSVSGSAFCGKPRKTKLPFPIFCHDELIMFSLLSTFHNYT